MCNMSLERMFTWELRKSHSLADQKLPAGATHGIEGSKQDECSNLLLYLFIEVCIIQLQDVAVIK